MADLNDLIDELVGAKKTTKKTTTTKKAAPKKTTTKKTTKKVTDMSGKAKASKPKASNDMLGDLLGSLTLGQGGSDLLSGVLGGLFR